MTKEEHVFAEHYCGSLQRLQAAGTFTDFTIECGGWQWKVHRIVVSAHSRFFEKLFTSGFIESQEKMVKLEYDSALEIGLLIMFAYSLDYAYDPETSCEDYEDEGNAPDPLTLHTRMFILADKYGCEDLKRCTLSHFESALRDLISKCRRDKESLATCITKVAKWCSENVPIYGDELNPYRLLLEQAPRVAKTLGVDGWEVVSTEVPDYAFDALTRIRTIQKGVLDRQTVGERIVNKEVFTVEEMGLPSDFRELTHTYKWETDGTRDETEDETDDDTSQLSSEGA